MSPMKTKVHPTAVRYDDAARAKIAAYLKTHSNEEAKTKFCCSAHFAGALRRELKIKSRL